MRRIENHDTGLRNAGATSKTRWSFLATTLLVAAGEVLAQDRETKKSTAADASRGQPVRRIIVSIPDRNLVLVEADRVLKTYAVAVGAEISPTPAGQFQITSRIPMPTYYAPGNVIPPGKANPLGTRWMGLNRKGYGIHGTNEPGSIGHRASHGCIRMRNRDVEELFELVRVGDGVEVHGERIVELVQVFGAAEATPRSWSSPVAMTSAVLAVTDGQN